MAWFGEGFANLKTQVSNFTKEVLTEGREEDEEFAESDELRSAKKVIAELQELCSTQKKEIEQLRVQTVEWQEKSEAQDRQSKSAVESYEKLIQAKEEQNVRLRQQVDSLLLKQPPPQQQEQGREEPNHSSGLNDKVETSSGSFVQRRVLPETNTVGTGTEDLVPDEKKNAEPKEPVRVEVREVGTDPEPSDDVDILDDRLELEERCVSYQNDLFALREELMSLQHAVDEKEVGTAKLAEEILAFLHSEFIMDGEPAIAVGGKSSSSSHKAVHPHHHHHLHQLHHPFGSSVREENPILSALRLLSHIWKDLVDRKGTLERAVAKLSVEKTPLSHTDSVDSGGGGGGGGGGSGGGSRKLIIPPNFFPPAAIDSFGLETIIEDERGEEDNQRVGDGELTAAAAAGRTTTTTTTTTAAADDQPAHIAFIQPQLSQVQIQRRSGNAPLVTSSTQTEAGGVGGNEEDLEEESPVPTQDPHQEFLLLLQQKEGEWGAQVEEREDRIRKLETELERLRTHLVEFEEQATSDALVNEEREKALQQELAQLRAQIAQTLKESDRIGDVKEELSRLRSERDAAIGQTGVYEDQIQKLGIQLQNLHFVLEQFQKEKETELRNMDRVHRREISELMSEKESLGKEVRTKEELLEKARSGLEAAQQLSAQIEEKSRLISALKAQVQAKEDEVEKLKGKIKEVGSNLDGKIDRYLVKNLIVGYFSTPGDKRKEVLRVIATVLDFNREDRQKTGLEAGGIWPFRSAGEPAGEKPSLSEAFIRFLETESQPKVQVRMGTEEITRRSSKSGSSPSTLPGESPPLGSSNFQPVVGPPGTSALSSSASPHGSPTMGLIGNSNSTSGSSTSTSSGVPEISMSLPVLSQTDRSNSILKDVLNPKP